MNTKLHILILFWGIVETEVMGTVSESYENNTNIHL